MHAIIKQKFVYLDARISYKYLKQHLNLSKGFEVRQFEKYVTRVKERF